MTSVQRMTKLNMCDEVYKRDLVDLLTRSLGISCRRQYVYDYVDLNYSAYELHAIYVLDLYALVMLIYMSLIL